MLGPSGRSPLMRPWPAFGRRDRASSAPTSAARSIAFPVHAELITKNGIVNHENLNFDELIAERKYQFVYIFSPVPLKGATGSAGSPMAVT